MKTFNVEISTQVKTSVEIEAASEEEAKALVYDKWLCGEIDIYDDIMANVSFKINK